MTLVDAELPFGSWTPDKAAYKNPGLVDAVNVYPSPGGYAPFEKPVPTGSALPNVVYGARFLSQTDASSIIVAGISDGLLHIDGSTITETSGLNPIGADTAWDFERFNDLVIAVSLENVPQYLDDVDTDTMFSALPGSPPQAAVVGKVSDWLVLGNLVDTPVAGNPTVPHRVRWSAFNNPTGDWVSDRGEQSDFRDLPSEFGKVTGIVGGRWGLVFQERAIWRMDYVGAPTVFEFSLLTEDRGCVATGSLVTIGYTTYFLDRGGFFATNGSDVEPIGDGVLNEWFETNSDIAVIRTVHGSINWPKRSVVWAYRSPNAATGFDGLLMYSFVTGEWSRAEIVVDYLVQDKQDAKSLADLAALFPGGLGTMAAYTVGAAEFRGRNRVLAGFQDSSQSAANLLDESGLNLEDESSGNLQSSSGSANFVVFTGGSARAELTTGDQVLNVGRRTLVDGVLPVVELETGEITVSTRSRGRQGATFTATQATEPGVDGYASQRTDDWFHSFNVVIAEDSIWDKASGLWIRSKATGRR